MATTFRTSADATIASQTNSSNSLVRSITAKRTDRFVKPLKEAILKINEDDEDTPSGMQYGYGLVKMETDRVFREIDSSGDLHLVDLISGDEIDGVLSYLITGTGLGLLFPGDFPGSIRPDHIIRNGRYSGTGPLGHDPPNGSQVRLFTGDQTAPDPELVAETSVDSQFIGRGLSYIRSKWVFQEARFDGDPTVEVICRSRRVADPRTAADIDNFDDLPKSFAINPYRFIYDYLVRPKAKGGAGVDPTLIDLETFSDSCQWGEGVVDTQQFSFTAPLTTRTNQQNGVPPNATNHLFEFEESVCPFQYGDVVRITLASGQSAPSNLSTGVDYYVIPIRHAVNDFQFPAVALAASYEDSLNGISIPQGLRISDIIITKVREIRYQSALTYRHGDDILPDLLESCGAALYLNNGKISISTQRFPEAVDIEHVETDELIGSLAMSTSLDSADRATSLSGVFTSLTNLFFTRDYPSVSGDGLFEEQDGIASPQTYDLPFVAKGSIAQRLATIELRKRRQELSIAFSGDLSLFRLTPDTYFTMDFPKYNLDEETIFQVQDQVVFLRIVNDAPFLGVNIEARQLEAGTFDLDVSNESFIDAASIPGLNSPFEVSAPGAPTIAEEIYQTRIGAGVKSRATVSWGASPSLFVTGYEVSFKRSDGDVFFFLAETPETSVVVEDLQPGFYDFRVVAINSTGRRSGIDDASTDNFQIYGLSARPGPIENLRGQVLGAADVLLRWDVSSDLDVVEGGQIEIRHDPAISGALARDSVFIDNDVGGQTSISVPFKIGTYFIRAVDSTGQFSDPSAWSTQDRRPVAVAQIPDGSGILQDTGGFSIQEDSTFPSTNPENTLVVVDNDHLELPREGAFDDVPDVDLVVSVDEVTGGTVAPQGIYVFSQSLELASVTRVIVEAVVVTEVFDLSSSIDDEPSFDGIADIDTVASALLQPGLTSAEIQCRFSNGTVASDTFGPWETLDTQFFDARSFEFRILANSYVPSVNLRINQARVRMRAVPL